jgi:Tfp pilus assembly protein PilX
MKICYQKGIVLVTVLLFVAVLSLLVFSVMYTAILQIKMSYNDKEKAVAFYAAEKQLAIYEHELTLGHSIIAAEIILCNICGVTLYRVTALAAHKTAQSKLQSTFAVLGDTSKCVVKPIIKSGRQLWRIIL